MSDDVNISDIRAWAADNDVECGKRGRISQALVDAYNKANPRRKFTGNR